MMHTFTNVKKLTGMILLILLSTTSLFAQNIKGTITSKDGTLPGASIHGVTFKLSTSSDLNGEFTLNAQVTGKAKIAISYIGYATKIIDLELNSGMNSLGNIELIAEHKNSLSEVTISGSMAPSQAKAYSIKKNSNAIMDVMAADAIGKLPDRNAAEAVQRMQGVAVARYHGEADQATVRGTPFAWTSTLFNGNRLPSSNVMGNRSSVLDAVPSEMIQYVQVAKAITPDMEGDAIGGSINFITRTAPTTRQLNVSAAGGYNTFSKNGTYNASLVYGDRFLNDKLGVMLSGAIWDRQWGADSFDASYNTGLADPQQKKSINTIMFKRYMGSRQTMGVNLGTEYKFDASNKIFFRGMLNKFNDIRPVYESYVDYTNSRYQYNYRYSHYQTSLKGAELGGEHQLSSRLKLDWTVSDYKSKYYLETPPTYGTKGLPISTFRQKITGGFNNLSDDGKRYWGFDSPNGVGGDPMHFDAGLNNPAETMSADKLLLQQLVIAQLDNSEHDRNAQLNAKINVSNKINLKVGGKYRHKYRESTYGSSIVFMPGAALGVPSSPALVSLSQLETKDFPSGSKFFGTMDGNHSQYIMNPLTKNQLFNLYSNDFLTPNGFANVTPKTNPTALYNGKEQVFSAYAMTEIDATDQLKIIAGVRNEYTSMELKGSKATTAGTPAVTTISESTVSNNYNALLPMLHLKYALNEKSNLRAAYTRSFIRPSFGDMTPGTSVDNTKNPMTISQGNPDLKPTFSNNFDVMAEYYFDNIGIISGGAFYKKINDIVFTNASMQNINGTDFMVTQAKNLNNSTLFGFEAGINKRFDFLRGFWSGFGTELNYTFINSKVSVPRGTGNNITLDKTSLPNQSKHLFNAILFYERDRMMVRLAGNYRGSSVETINQQLGPDFYIWTAANFTIDASATYTINKHLKAFVELNNLSNEPVKTYMGDSRRLTTSEWYGRRGQAGIRWDIIR
ncbi:TonB-dependent receptor [Pedobacter steynii]|uniref:TonB-dependent receptor n=1 Tax=Pedobacter steynii TaxID=430522 RepID=A0A1D7QLJ0_9SPHI|nr:TonB-dependent receptor [Pedobacter steynii]AOM79517.1 TonB-dependent receptor [Pedobacter steynii]